MSDTHVTAALLYGHGHESNALSHYKQQHPNYSVQEPGLWLNPKHPTLGCSPDGVFIDRLNVTKGLVEKKCPSVLRNCNPLNFIETLSTNQCIDFCCVKDNQGNLRLRRNHKYYYQIQMQLALCELECCDFVVWSPKGCQWREFLSIMTCGLTCILILRLYIYNILFQNISSCNFLMNLKLYSSSTNLHLYITKHHVFIHILAYCSYLANHR